MTNKLKINKEYHFSKVGIDEIVGLKAAMIKLMKPIEAAIQDKAYWLRDATIIEESEYKSRDGFIPHGDNCGGPEISVIIPECESYEFDFLEFGEWDGEHYCNKNKKQFDTCDDCECCYDGDGNYDAKLRVWFKFEGLDEETGELSFYLYLGGGNGDAPYFRTSYEADIFEASFTCKSIEGLTRAASKHIKALLKIVNG